MFFSSFTTFQLKQNISSLRYLLDEIKPTDVKCRFREDFDHLTVFAIRENAFSTKAPINGFRSC